MATVIRFARHGTKKRPYFRMVVQDKTAAVGGRFIEHIGAFDPLKGNELLSVKRDRLEYWLSTGAIMSDTVREKVSLLQTQSPAEQKVSDKLKASSKMKKSAPKETEAS